MTKCVVPMWLIHDALYHYSDKQRADSQADGKDEAYLVYVGVDADYFIGTWQFADQFEGWIFEDKSIAESEVEKYNNM